VPPKMMRMMMTSAQTGEQEEEGEADDDVWAGVTAARRAQTCPRRPPSVGTPNSMSEAYRPNHPGRRRRLAAEQPVPGTDPSSSKGHGAEDLGGKVVCPL
jgi:hypothetical protein